VFAQTGSNWIESHVPHGSLELRFVADEPRVVPSSEYVMLEEMLGVEASGVDAIQPLHTARESFRGGSEHQVEMIRHQTPRERLPLSIALNAAEEP